MTSRRAAAARSWRATLHALAGLPLGLGALVVLGGIVLVWGAAIASLLDGPTGGWELAVLYVVAAVAGPIPVLWGVRTLTALQRARFRATLGVQIPAVRDVAGTWPLRLIRPWRSPTIWRQLGYHVLTLLTGVGGGLLVLSCWLAPLLAVGYADELWGRGLRLGLGSAVLALAMLLAAPPGGQRPGQDGRGRGPDAARSQPQRRAGAPGRVAGPQPGRHRRRDRRRTPPDRTRPA
jgi:hypothetical protein